MSSLTRLATVAAVCVGLMVAGSPAGAADSTGVATTTTTTVVADAGIQSAGLASRAPGARCAKKDSPRRAAAKRHCAQRPGGR